MAELQLLRAEVRLGGMLRTAGLGAEVTRGQAVRGQKLPKGHPWGGSSHRVLKLAGAIAIQESLKQPIYDE